MNKWIILWVGLGGLLGSIARYLMASAMSRIMTTAFPLGTFTVNIIGCLLIGLFFGLSEKYQWMTPELRIFLTTGFCGGFTTFSSFAFENVFLLQTGEYLTFTLYTAASILLGLAGVFAGAYLARIA
jgi:CrcB protein